MKRTGAGRPLTTDTPTLWNGYACFPVSPSTLYYADPQNPVAAPINAGGDGASDLAIYVPYPELIDGYWLYVPSTTILLNDLTDGARTLAEPSSEQNDYEYTSPFLFSEPWSGFPSDFNADALADGFYEDSGHDGWVALGNGDGTFTDIKLSVAVGANTATYTGNFGGTACTDVLEQGQDGGTTALDLFCDPPEAPGAVKVTQITSGIPDFAGGIVLGDFNGDSNTDVLVPGGTNTDSELYLSTGTGFANKIDLGSSTKGWANYTVVTGDWNGDGKTDIALISQNGQPHTIYVSTGVFGNNEGFDEIGSPASCNCANVPTVADLDNRGASSIWVQSSLDTADEITFGYTPELMTIISNGIGATINVGYDRLNRATIYSKGSGAVYPMQDAISAMYVVSQIQTSGGSTSTDQTYLYAGLKKDLYGRGLLGFQTIAITDNQTNQPSIVRTLSYGVSGNMTFPDNTMLSSDVSTYYNSNTQTNVTLKSIANTYYVNDTNDCPGIGQSNIYAICIKQSVVSGTDADGTTQGGTYNWPTSTTTYTWDDYGNVLTQKGMSRGMLKKKERRCHWLVLRGFECFLKTSVV